ncbi:hypothetical protein CLD20_08240 [Afifella sp. IM 167]|nr:hypothetical protein [Afifella sp. IM 167]
MTGAGGVAAGQLRAFIERIERLEEEKKELFDDIRHVYGEAKAHGYDTKVMRQVVKLRKLDPAERQEQEALLDLYMGALGTLPLFQSDAAEGGEGVPGCVAAVSAKNEHGETVAEWRRGTAKPARRASETA